MKNKHSQLLVAALSKMHADKDKSLAIIQSITEEGAGEKGINVELLKIEFQKIANLELAMVAIQTYFANNLPIPEEQNINSNNNNDDGNNS